MQNRFQNITYRVGQAAPNAYLPRRHFHLPRHSVQHLGELRCEDSAQSITCQAGQVRVLLWLPDCRFLPNSLATWDRASGYVARCSLYISHKNCTHLLLNLPSLSSDIAHQVAGPQYNLSSYLYDSDWPVWSHLAPSITNHKNQHLDIKQKMETRAEKSLLSNEIIA